MGGILELQLGLVLLGESGQHAVEDVVVPLLRHLIDDPGLFEQVLLDLCALDDAILVEDDVDVLAEPGGVVVANGLGISKSCKEEQVENIIVSNFSTFTLIS